jgi:hypothetical protein
VSELTRLTGRVAFEIAPVPGDLERLLAGLGRDLARTENGFELALEAHEQDQVVDRLRAARVSIRSIAPGKLDLEQAFIELVKGAQP